jgi:UDP-N-acetylglucosamine--N-acetylmuramyl-(pentapeptide) pyrophosphoryl-undecaprenol N-acetylglucosamine transferase
MKVLITGAHFTPAQAVIEELLGYKGEEKGLEIVYVGRKSTREGDSSPSVESQVLPKLGVKFIPITTGRIRRYISFGTLVSLFKIPTGFIQAFLILLKEKPDVVVSFGGYVAVPLVFNAWLLNIPVIIHEQTLVSGLANTFSNLFAEKIAVSFEQEYSFSKNKLLITGNPMRKAVLSPDEKKVSKEIKEMMVNAKKDKNLAAYGLKKPLILITGGNQGSHVINEVIEQSLDQLVKKYIIVHQTGDSKFDDYGRLMELRKEKRLEKSYFPKKWIRENDMGVLFQTIDLAISRCGANTLLELAYHQVPTIMIPLPFVTKDEQTKNAKFFSTKGLGEVLLEKNLSVDTLLEKIEEMVKSVESKKNALKAKEVVILDAEKKLAQEILLLPYKS